MCFVVFFFVLLLSPNFANVTCARLQLRLRQSSNTLKWHFIIFCKWNRLNKKCVNFGIFRNRPKEGSSTSSERSPKPLNCRCQRILHCAEASTASRGNSSEWHCVGLNVYHLMEFVFKLINVEWRRRCSTLLGWQWPFAYRLHPKSSLFTSSRRANTHTNTRASTIKPKWLHCFMRWHLWKIREPMYLTGSSYSWRMEWEKNSLWSFGIYHSTKSRIYDNTAMEKVVGETTTPSTTDNFFSFLANKI